MNHFSQAVIATACISLSACGGGSDTSYDATAFPGTWSPVDASCDADFTYNMALFSKATTVVISASTVVVKSTIYNDAACTSKAGVLSETYALTLTEGKVSGWTNVAKVDVAWANSWSMALDGGTGVTLSSVPDGSFSLPLNKTLFAAKGNAIYMGDIDGALDSVGYPTTVEATPSLSR